MGKADTRSGPTTEGPERIADPGALIANIGHGIRSPLGPVLGYIELLLEMEPVSLQREYLELARAGVLEVTRLIDRLTGATPAAAPFGQAARRALRSPMDAAEPLGGCDEFGRSPEGWSPLVLVVDDDPVNLLVTERMLAKMGYDAEVAHDGAEAVRRVEGREYDLVLMDLQMPGMTGLEAIDRIRDALPWHRQPVIVALTAGAAAADRDRVLASEMDGYLTKPVRLGELADVLDTLRGSRRDERARALALQPPAVPVVDLDALVDWVGVADLTTPLVELTFPALLEDVADLIDRLGRVMEDQHDAGAGAAAFELAGRARSLFVGRLAWALEHLAEALESAHWAAVATMAERLVDEYLALESWAAAQAGHFENSHRGADRVAPSGR